MDALPAPARCRRSRDRFWWRCATLRRSCRRRSAPCCCGHFANRRSRAPEDRSFGPPPRAGSGRHRTPWANRRGNPPLWRSETGVRAGPRRPGPSAGRVTADRPGKIRRAWPQARRRRPASAHPGGSVPFRPVPSWRRPAGTAAWPVESWWGQPSSRSWRPFVLHCGTLR